MCRVEEETADNLCEVATAVWSHYICRCGLYLCNPSTFPVPAEAQRRASFFGCGLLLWRIIPFMVFLSIWKEKNKRIFRGAHSSLEELFTSVNLRISKRAKVRKELLIFSVDNILLNWKACLVRGTSRRRRIVFWFTPDTGVLRFNVDGD